MGSEQGYQRLARNAERRVLAGVCTGLGRYTGIDPVVFRVGFAVLVLAHGQGVFLYIAAAVLMPARPGESALAERLLKRWFDAGAVLSVLGALLTAGVVFSLFGAKITDTVALLVVFGLALLVAHSRGADLVSVARSVPERLTGHPPAPTPEPAPESARAEAGAATGLREGMIDLAAYSAAHTAAPPLDDRDTRETRSPKRSPRPERGGSPAAAITLLGAMAAGAAMIPVAQGYPAPDAWLIIMAPALAVVGLGLVLGGWFRTRGLVAAGTVLTLAMLTTSVVRDAPQGAEYGEIEWRPTDAAQTNQVYKVGVGQGDLDLTLLTLAPGQRVTIVAEVALGGLDVTVPSTARVLVDARVTLGDLSVDRRTTGGPRAKVVRTLEPESVQAGGEPPVIELRIRGKLGDVSVNRG